MNAGSGALTISGTGNLAIGTNRELVIIANAQTTTISNIIADHSGGPSSVTYSGGGYLTLSAVNTYSGGTTVTAGTINPYGNGSGSARAYNRSVASRPPGTTQSVEYGDDLTGWTQLTILLENATNVTITHQGETDRVEVTLPALGAKGFARLKVSQ